MTCRNFIVGCLVVSLLAVQAAGSLGAQPPGFERAISTKLTAPGFTVMCFSPNGQHLVHGSTTSDRGFIVHRFQSSGVVKGRLPGSLGAGMFSSDGRLFFCAHNDQRSIAVWSVENWQPVRKLPVSSDRGIVSGMAPDELVAVNGIARLITVTGELRSEEVVPDDVYSAVAVHGDVLVLGAEDGRIEVRDRGLTKLLKKTEPLSREITSISIAAGNGQVAVGLQDGHVMLWSERCEEWLRTVKTPYRWITQVLWIEPTKHLLICSNEGKAQVMDVETGEVRWEWNQAGSTSVHAAVSPDFSRLAIGEQFSQEIEVWTMPHATFAK